MRSVLAAFIAGLLFGIGLAVSQMINPEKVLAFLDVSGNWDPSLALVMASALLVSAIGYRLSQRRAQPVFATRFEIPTSRDIDWRLLTGALIFGIGWGLAGYCPGPALAAAGIGTAEPLIFVVAMLAGSGVARVLERRRHAG